LVLQGHEPISSMEAGGGGGGGRRRRRRRRGKNEMNG
jgi:hypothetical protein